MLVLFSFQPLFPPAKKAVLKKPAVIPRVKINSAPTGGSDNIYQVSDRILYMYAQTCEHTFVHLATHVHTYMRDTLAHIHTMHMAGMHYTYITHPCLHVRNMLIHTNNTRINKYTYASMHVRISTVQDRILARNKI